MGNECKKTSNRLFSTLLSLFRQLLEFLYLKSYKNVFTKQLLVAVSVMVPLTFIIGEISERQHQCRKMTRIASVYFFITDLLRSTTYIVNVFENIYKFMSLT